MNTLLTPAEFARRGAETALKIARNYSRKDADAFAIACLRSVGFSESAAKKAVKKAKKP